jgi:hypothetical protein
VVDVAHAGAADKTVNLNNEVKAEADRRTRFTRQALQQRPVAIDAARRLCVHREPGAPRLPRDADGTGKPTLGNPPTRIATGNLPNGIVVSGATHAPTSTTS